MDRASDF